MSTLLRFANIVPLVARFLGLAILILSAAVFVGCSTQTGSKLLTPPSVDATLPYDDRYDALFNDVKAMCRDEKLDDLMYTFDSKPGSKVYEIAQDAGQWVADEIGNEVSDDGVLDYATAGSTGCAAGIVDRPNFDAEFS